MGSTILHPRTVRRVLEKFLEKFSADFFLRNLKGIFYYNNKPFKFKKMKTQNNMTSLISQAEWWVKKTQTNQVRGTFNWELFMKLIEAKRNENKKN